MLLHSTQFTTDSYPTGQRVQAWQKALEALSLQPSGIADRDKMHGTVSSTVSPHGIVFARISSGPQSILYDQNADLRSGSICVALHMEGRALLAVQNEPDQRLSSGDIVYGPSGSSGSVAMQSNFRQLFIKIPRQALRSRLAVPLSMKMGRVSGESGIGHVFSGMLGSIADTLDKLTPDQIRPIEIALLEFLVSSLAHDESTRGMVASTSTQTTNLHRISQLIESRLGDPDLSITRCAEEAGVSPRYLQKLFEAVGESFSHYVRARRLERCRADLVNPLYAHLSISEICFRWCFNDAAHFSRVFHDEYGLSPRAYRRDIGKSVSKSMQLHQIRGWPETPRKSSVRLDQQELSPIAVTGRTQTPEPEEPALCSKGARPPRHYQLPANERTVHWGFFSRSLKPVLAIESGDYVTVETLTQHCFDDYERMIQGDPGAESVLHWTPDKKNVDRRGAGPMDASIYGRGAGEGFGVHICTGPIYIEGAEPGDVVEVRILDVQPRPSGNAKYDGRTFGSNAATWWGLHYGELLCEPKPREVVTIYELKQAAGHNYARAIYNFRWTPQTDPFGIVHTTIDYPGVPVDHRTIVKNYDVLRNVRIPVNPHFGVIGLAPKEADIVDSIPPSAHGGNIDNKRAGKGASMYLPVAVPGGLLSIGDPHASQGDSELCGTAIECSMTGTFQIILHKKEGMKGRPFEDINYPLLETPEEWVVHGFSFANYLAELGEQAQSEIYKQSSLDAAMKDAFRKMRRLLMTMGLTEDEAISLMSVAVDFGITQVVDGNWCVHGILRKDLFVEDTIGLDNLDNDDEVGRSAPEGELCNGK